MRNRTRRDENAPADAENMVNNAGQCLITDHAHRYKHLLNKEINSHGRFIFLLGNEADTIALETRDDRGRNAIPEIPA